MSKPARILAFYLPQFHPIPENDEWWGKGFTEWTNVAKARPLYKGHYQPRVPADLGFYDLRVPEVRQAQADMASAYGVEGFVYWHYWFSGKRLLERPLMEVLESGKPDYPFCLAWANETWSGRWHGLHDKILVKQEYPGKPDYEKHFFTLLEAFKDPRYIRVEDKPLFYILKPEDIPDTNEFISLWNKLARKSGLEGIYFTGPAAYPEKDGPALLNAGYNAIHSYRFEEAFSKLNHRSLSERFIRKMLKMCGLSKKVHLNLFNYPDLIINFITDGDRKINFYPTIYPGWDNSPRSGHRAMIMENSHPENFSPHVKRAIEVVQAKPPDHRIIFLKSWNEWAEGNYMEPDLKYGTKFLEVLKEELDALVR